MLLNYSKRACKLAGRCSFTQNTVKVFYTQRTCSVLSVRNKKYHSTATRPCRTPGQASRFPPVTSRRMPSTAFPYVLRRQRHPWRPPAPASHPPEGEAGRQGRRALRAPGRAGPSAAGGAAPRREWADSGDAGLRARGGAESTRGCHSRLPLPATSLKYYGAAVAAAGAAAECTMRAVIAFATALGSTLLGGCLLRLGGERPLRAR